MSKLNLEPTSENIFSTFMDNKIDRNEDVFKFVRLLTTIDTNFSIALDGQWGTGKTFFVKHIAMVLDSLYDSLHSEFKSNYDQVMTEIPEDLKNVETKNFSIYFDAWINDNDDDPLLSILYTIVCNYKTGFPNEQNWDRLFCDLADIALDNPITTILTAGANRFIKKGIEKTKSIKNNFTGEYLFTKIEKAKNIEKRIHSFLQSLIEEAGSKRIVIFIDELDRCKPSYAIQLLERIKHYMLHEKITFVFSTNLTELSHTIKQCYGAGFNGSSYLEKFFGYKFSLPQLTFKQQNKLIPLGNASSQDMVFEFFVNKFNVQMRLRLKMITDIRKFVAKNLNPRFYSSSGEACLSLAKFLFIPYVICLKNYDIEKYIAFIHGEDSCSIEETIAKRLLLDIVNITVSEVSPKTQNLNIDAKNVILNLYHAIFTPLTSDPSYARERQIDNITLLPDIKEFIIREANNI